MATSHTRAVLCNLLDLASVAVPGTPTVAGEPFGVMFVVPGIRRPGRLDLAGLGTFLSALPAPMALTNVELSEGRIIVGSAAPTTPSRGHRHHRIQ